ARVRETVAEQPCSPPLRILSVRRRTRVPCGARWHSAAPLSLLYHARITQLTRSRAATACHIEFDRSLFMNEHLDQLEPALLWRHFRTFCDTPRPSWHEEAILQKIEAWADTRGFAHGRDAAGNLR